jgi:hypothetical protein
MPEQHGADDGNRKPSFDLGMLRQIGDPAAAEIGPFNHTFCRPHLADDPLQ